jgi:hypothetical protein
MASNNIHITSDRLKYHSPRSKYTLVYDLPLVSNINITTPAVVSLHAPAYMSAPVPKTTKNPVCRQLFPE